VGGGKGVGIENPQTGGRPLGGEGGRGGKESTTSWVPRLFVESILLHTLSKKCVCRSFNERDGAVNIEGGGSSVTLCDQCKSMLSRQGPQDSVCNTQDIIPEKNGQVTSGQIHLILCPRGIKQGY